jgi:hypothetical protein
VFISAAVALFAFKNTRICTTQFFVNKLSIFSSALITAGRIYATRTFFPVEHYQRDMFALR